MTISSVNSFSKELGLVIPSLTAITNPNHMASTMQKGALSFSEYLQNDVKGFLNRTKAGEEKTFDYINGKEDIENLVPHVKSLLLEFEEKTRLLGAMIGAVKNLLSTHM